MSGQVQGVGFRYFVQRQAQKFSLVGWVRNLTDGRVEAVAEGSRAELEQLLALIHQGPSGASVETIIESWEPASGEFLKFEIRRTG